MALLLFGFRFFGFLHVVCKPVQYLNSMGIPLHGCTGSIWTWQIEGCKQYFNRFRIFTTGPNQHTQPGHQDRGLPPLSSGQGPHPRKFTEEFDNYSNNIFCKWEGII
eukprot:EG_transcript_11850